MADKGNRLRFLRTEDGRFLSELRLVTEVGKQVKDEGVKTRFVRVWSPRLGGNPCLRTHPPVPPPLFTVPSLRTPVPTQLSPYPLLCYPLLFYPPLFHQNPRIPHTQYPVRPSPTSPVFDTYPYSLSLKCWSDSHFVSPRSRRVELLHSGI